MPTRTIAFSVSCGVLALSFVVLVSSDFAGDVSSQDPASDSASAESIPIADLRNGIAVLNLVDQNPLRFVILSRVRPEFQRAAEIWQKKVPGRVVFSGAIISRTEMAIGDESTEFHLLSTQHVDKAPDSVDIDFSLGSETGTLFEVAANGNQAIQSHDDLENDPPLFYLGYLEAKPANDYFSGSRSILAGFIDAHLIRVDLRSDEFWNNCSVNRDSGRHVVNWNDQVGGYSIEIVFDDSMGVLLPRSLRLSKADGKLFKPLVSFHDFVFDGDSRELLKYECSSIHYGGGFGPSETVQIVQRENYLADNLNWELAFSKIRNSQDPNVVVVKGHEQIRHELYNGRIRKVIDNSNEDDQTSAIGGRHLLVAEKLTIRSQLANLTPVQPLGTPRDLALICRHSVLNTRN